MAVAYLLRLAFFFPLGIQYILILFVAIWGYGFAKPNQEQHRADKRGLIPLHNSRVTESSRDAKPHKEQ
jgi:hypothetical protein